ncbi:MAG: ROK family protein, partial [Verrucomicrobia bacterium]|nr:ROK family protein [Verrucomicrobiota bacterium]
MISSPVFGIDIGGTKCAASILQKNGRVRELGRIVTGAPAATLEQLARVVEQHGAGRNPTFGIACGCPLDLTRGLVMSPFNLPGWDR